MSGGEGGVAGVQWWKKVGSPRCVLAPMVEQSEPAFRLLCRELGVGLTVTPMMHASLVRSCERYRSSALSQLLPCECDRPLSAQICAADPTDAKAAAEIIARSGRVDAVDINMGCPQHNARKGGYGAYLEEGVDAEVVRAAVAGCGAAGNGVVVTVKIRCHEEGPLRTAARCRRLLAAGAVGVTLHGRLRSERGEKGQQADWVHIKECFSTLQDSGAWLCANGGLLRGGDAERLLNTTAAHSVMSAEALLWDPGYFATSTPLLTARIFNHQEGEEDVRRRSRCLAMGYLRAAAQAPCTPYQVQEHLLRVLAPVFDRFPLIRAEAEATADAGRKPRFEDEFILSCGPAHARRSLCLWAQVVRAAAAAEALCWTPPDEAAPLGRVMCRPGLLSVMACPGCELCGVEAHDCSPPLYTEVEPPVIYADAVLAPVEWLPKMWSGEADSLPEQLRRYRGASEGHQQRLAQAEAEEGARG
eukprot:Hpha_TRINITY_DN33641_c0_g1::TRINITY_DN33641_c0_g1_i1::g.43121::m.43121/K05542/DUS1; tRNA-dihydrouridine synthase 1